MNVIECIKRRRSIRKYKSKPIDHSIIDSIVSAASLSILLLGKTPKSLVILQLKIHPFWIQLLKDLPHRLIPIL